jgi:hypothetical protein
MVADQLHSIRKFFRRSRLIGLMIHSTLEGGALRLYFALSYCKVARALRRPSDIGTRIHSASHMTMRPLDASGRFI